MSGLKIREHTFKNRFFLGTGKFPSNKLMKEAIKKSGTELVTVALRRVDTSAKEENILSYIPNNVILMPNTSGARNAEEAVRIARLSREICQSDWIKIEVINDSKYLLPDNQETIKATEILAKEGFIVMPYVSPDLMDARRLVDAGTATIMPLGAPIGTNKGITTIELIKILINEIDIPIVVDAGIGAPSHAAIAMEIGSDAVLVNTAVAIADDPVNMAFAFSLATEAGRKGYEATLAKKKDVASASSPLTGFLHS